MSILYPSVMWVFDCSSHVRWRLITLQNAAQETLIVNLANSIGSSFWIGLEDRYRFDSFVTQRDSRSWVWEDGSPYKYAVTKWDSGHPTASAYCVVCTVTVRT